MCKPKCQEYAVPSMAQSSNNSRGRLVIRNTREHKHITIDVNHDTNTVVWTAKGHGKGVPRF